MKSAEPWLLFYDLGRLEEVKKLRLRKPNQQTQDDGCCFSPDGERFFNLEAQNDMTGQLVIYDTRGFAEQARLFEGARLVPQHIEPAESGDAYFLLGYERPSALEGDGWENAYFVARLDAKGGLERRPLDAERYQMLEARKSWERAGFTAKKAEWTFPYLGGEIPEAVPLPLERVFAEA